MGAFKNWFRAWLGVGVAPSALVTSSEPPTLKINDMTVAEARMSGRPAASPWTAASVPAFFPGDRAGMALDRTIAGDGISLASVYQWAAASGFSEGLGFLGYPYLAELMQRPEYRRIVEIYASEATRKGVKFKGDEDKIDELEKRLSEFAVWPILRRAVEHDGGFGRGQIFVDVGDDASTERGAVELAKPFVIKAKVAKGALKGFRNVEPLWSYPGQYESSNPLHADFYRPKQWYVMSTIVDDSRLIMIRGRELPDILKPAYAFGGLALTQMAKPYVDNWLRTRQSVSDLLHSFSTMVLKTNMGGVMLGKAAGEFFKRLDLFNRTRDNRGIMAIDKESEDMTNVSTPLGTLDKLLAQSQEQIASVVGIPLVVLLGVTPSGLNASSDGEVRTFYATIKSYQERVLRKPLEIMIECVQRDLWGEPDEDITFEFVDLWEMDEKAKAEIRKSDADMDAAYVQAGIVSPEEVRARITEDEASPYYGVDLSAPAPEPPEMPGPGEDDPEGGDGGDEGGQPGAKPEGGQKIGQDADFEESKHPRAANGQFGSGGASGGSGKSKASAGASLEAAIAARGAKKPDEASQHANAASEVARWEGEHDDAAQAHEFASVAHKEAGNHERAKEHADKAKHHYAEAARPRSEVPDHPAHELKRIEQAKRDQDEGPVFTDKGKAVPHHVVHYLGRAGVENVKALVRDPNSKARDILDTLKPLDEMSKSETPTVEHDATPPPEFWRGRTYRDKRGRPMNVKRARDYLVNVATEYASADGGVGLRKERKARLLLGPPAAGKSTSAEQIARTQGYAIVDGDDAKKVIPEFKDGLGASAVHQESSLMSSDVLVSMLERGDNVILPLVGGSPGSIRKRIETLKAAGYDVTVDLVDVNEDEAARRMAGRALGTGRHISSSYFMSIGDGPSKTYETLKGEYPDLGFGKINGNGGLREEHYTEARNHPTAEHGSRLF